MMTLTRSLMLFHQTFKVHLPILLVTSLLLSSLLVSNIKRVEAQDNIWLHTSRQDFANGTAWNLDLDADPGNLTLASSKTTWIRSAYNPGLRHGPPGSWDDSILANPVVLKEDGGYKMWYGGDDSNTGTYRIGYATSIDGVNWTKPRLGLIDYGGNANNNLVMDLGATNTTDDSAILPGTIIRDSGLYKMWFSCKGVNWSICFATSSDGLTWNRHPLNPVITSNNTSDLLSPAVHFDGSKFSMWYAKRDTLGLHQLRYAESSDGVSWIESIPIPNQGLGEAGSWNEKGILPGTVHFSQGKWHMWYSGTRGTTQSIGYSESSDGTSWKSTPLNPILERGSPGYFDSVSLSRPWVIADGPRNLMWYAGFDGSRWNIGTVMSAFGEKVEPPKTNPVVLVGGLESWDSGGMFRPSVLRKDGIYHMWYTGSKNAIGSSDYAIGHATSVDGVRWTKSTFNPVFRKNASGWDSAWVGFAWVMWNETSHEFTMWYTGSDGASINVGVATSHDGESWTRASSNPIMINYWQPWFNGTDVRCPWVGRFQDIMMMFVGTNKGTSVSIAKALSSDGGMTWDVPDVEPALSPVAGTWQSTSVSCPTALVNSTGQEIQVWYEGSSSTAIASFGSIGFAFSSNSGVDFGQSLNDTALSGGRIWNVNGIGGPSVLRTDGYLRMWHHGTDLNHTNIGLALSIESLNWHDSFVEPQRIGEGSSSPVVLQKDPYWPSWTMFYAKKEKGTWSIVYSISPDGKQWGGIFGVNISGASPGNWDGDGRKPLTVMRIGTTYHLWYAGLGPSGRWSIGHATSNSISDWATDALNPILSPGAPPSWDCESLGGASVLYPGLTYPFEMWYSGFDGTTWRIGFAYSYDGSSWTKTAANPILYPSGGTSWDSFAVSGSRVIVEGGVYHIFYSGYDGWTWSLGHAFSENGINWVKSKINPILGGRILPNIDSPDIRTAWVEKSDSTYRMWFSNSEENDSAIGYAEGSFLSVGTLHSSPIDSGNIAPTWKSVTVTKRTSRTSSISTSVRTGMPPFTSVDWEDDVFSSDFQPQAGRNRYLQYRLTFTSMTGELTPLVEEISGEYEADRSPQALPLTPSAGSCSCDNKPTFSWLYSDPEGDIQNRFNLEVSKYENFSQVEYSIDAPVNLNQSRPSASLSDGTYYWRVKVWDSYGMASSWSNATEFIIDTIAPRTSLNYTGAQVGSSPRYISPATQLSFDVDDVGCGGFTWVRIDKGNWQQFVNPLTFTVPGHHLVEFYSVDVAGNQETIKSDDIWVDATPPAATIVTGSPSVMLGGTLFITPYTPLLLEASDVESGVQKVEYKIDSSGNWSTAIGPFLLFALSGEHTLYYRSYDYVGNVETTRTQRLNVDGKPPVTSVSIEGTHTQGTPIFVTPSTKFSLSADDEGVGVEGIWYSIDDGPAYQYTDSLSISAEGLHTLRFYARDLLGNLEFQNVLLVYVDGQGPATSLIPLGPSYQTPTEMFLRSTTAVMFASVDGGSGLELINYSVDGGPWTQYTSPFNISTPGHHTLSFYGVDVVGNVEQTKVLSIIIDDEPPNATISLDGTVVEYNGLTYVDNTTEAIIEAVDGGSGVLFVNYRLDGSSWLLYEGPIALRESGTHTIEAQVIDNLGIVGESQIVNVIVDALPPVANAGKDIAVFAPAEIFLNASASTDDTTIVRYEWVAQWNGSVLLESVVGTISFDSPGDYNVLLRVRDPLGRESEDSLVIRVMIDPDSDRDMLPDIWEMEQFGDLSQGPNDDTDGDGITNLQEYEQLGSGEIDDGGTGDASTRDRDDSSDFLLLILFAVVGILIGIIITQLLKNRDLRRKLDDRNAEESIEMDDSDED